MADISQVKLPNGTTYNLKDSYVRTNYRALSNNDFDTINVTELNAGDLIVTGAARFLNTINGNISGNAATATSATSATKATQDESGNNIKATYAASFSISDHTITLKNKNGVSLGTVTVPDNDHYAWTDITGKPSTFTPSAHTHFSLMTEGDNRTVATTPNDYKNNFIFKGLKAKATIDTPSGDVYSYLIGLRGWSDSSGGDAWELAFNNSGINVRHGATTTWGSWTKLLDSSNYNDYAPTKTGTGASGTWGISVSGNAATATTASKLGSSNVGSATQPIYLASGTATACTYSLNKTVPSDAVFTDHYDWADITNKPVTFITNSGALATNGWKTLGGRSSGNKIAISYASSSPATWNSEQFSASIVFGCNDTKGLVDCGYNNPIVTFGGANVNGSTDNAPTWYFKITGTSATTYNLNNITNGNARDNTKVAKTGDTMTGCLSITSANSSWAEGIRINRGAGGFCSFTMGGVANSTSGTGDNVWWLGCNPASYSHKWFIAHSGSTQSGTYFYVDSASQYSPHFRVGGDLAVGSKTTVSKSCTLRYNDATSSIDFIFTT